MLEVDRLVLRYGPFLALDRLSLKIDPGEIVGVVGPNGAGKSSVVRTLGGLVTPQEGTVRFEQADLLPIPAEARVRRGLSIVPEGRGLFPRMSVEENLRMGGHVLGDRARLKQNLERAYAMFPILSERRWQAAGTLSGGQQQMLAVSVGLMPDPRLLVLDEPSLGLAPIVIGEIGRTLKSLRETGLTVLLFEQNAKLTCDVADRIYIVASGAVRHHDRSELILASEEVQELLI